MIVTSHRTPRPRVDLNPARKAPTDDAGEALRIWKLLRQSAEGCNSTEVVEA